MNVCTVILALSMKAYWSS